MLDFQILDASSLTIIDIGRSALGLAAHAIRPNSGLPLTLTPPECPPTHCRLPYGCTARAMTANRTSLSGIDVSPDVAVSHLPFRMPSVWHIVVGLIAIVRYHSLALPWCLCITIAEENSHRQPPPRWCRWEVKAAGGYVAQSGKGTPLGSNCKIAGLLLIRRLLTVATGIGFLLLEMLGMGGTVAITAGLFLPAGFHTGIRSFRLHTKPSKIEILKRQAVRLYF